MTPKVILFLGLAACASATVRLQERYSWHALDWNYPDEYSRQQALLSGTLVPENALPVGVERWRNKLFVTVPRWRAGIPATLNYIPLDAPYEPSPRLNPYPSWEGNELGNCQTGLNTVYRIKADKCDRLWVLDTGTYGYDPNVTNPCPYSLNVYDLNTDSRIRRYVFRPEDIVPTTFIANIAVDLGSSCDDAFAYFSDELGYGLIAYSWEQNKSWRFSHNFFQPDPLRGDFNLAGLNFNWGTEGIFGIAVSPIGNDGFRTLYFSPLASHTEFAVSTRILRNETKVTDNYKDFQVVGTRSAESHLTAKVFDDNGVQLFSLIDQSAIGCWDSARSYKPQNIGVVDKDDVGLVFPSDVKIDADRNVWVLSDRMPVFLESNLDYSDINFRIYTTPLEILLQGSVCESTQVLKPYQAPKAPTLPLIPIQVPVVPAVPLYTGPYKNTNLGQVRYVVMPNSTPRIVNYNTDLQLHNLPNSTPRILNYNTDLQLQNLIPKVEQYINIPKQPSVAYRVNNKPQLLTTPAPYPLQKQNGRWWIKNAYEVYEQ